ncbi:hypothetical protein O181_112842 [Austropuccinia psidii MF-1]|uniref:Endonuclease/exonuclease/phosphatase domain-containing protein n=1 Tax=Austropuccinia psidii MF-1 TaxID=1389203 RepID=A0A9Q3PUR8_9BASI|nr:hypothetical protein [Austropuccinia psidii MF-1]
MKIKEITQKLTLKSIYNPPSTFEAIETLHQKLITINTRDEPIILGMDSNLHHRLWNSKGYHHENSQARHLIQTCGSRGFKLISPRHVPTFLGPTGAAATIDLSWANNQALKLLSSSETQLKNHSSDHQSIILNPSLDKTAIQTKESHIKMRLDKLNEK